MGSTKTLHSCFAKLALDDPNKYPNAHNCTRGQLVQVYSILLQDVKVSLRLHQPPPKTRIIIIPSLISNTACSDRVAWHVLTSFNLEALIAVPPKCLFVLLASSCCRASEEVGDEAIVVISVRAISEGLTQILQCCRRLQSHRGNSKA